MSEQIKEFKSQTESNKAMIEWLNKQLTESQSHKYKPPTLR